MRYTITGRNVNVTPGIRKAVEEKIGKLDRYFNPDTEVIVTLSVQKDRQKIEVTIPVKGNIIRAEESSSDMYVSIDLVEEVIERQLKKYKNKIIDKKQSAQAFSDYFINEETEDDEEIQIVKTKRFGIKPMDPEEACVQMELLNHNFYVFLNAETGVYLCTVRKPENHPRRPDQCDAEHFPDRGPGGYKRGPGIHGRADTFPGNAGAVGFD